MTGGARRLRVLHVMARMPVGGAERQLVGMLERAHSRHWDAHLCVLYPGYPLTEQAADFLPVTELPFTSPVDPRRPVALRGLARRISADVVHPTLWGAGWFTRLAVAGPRRPAVVMSECSVEDFRPRRRRLMDAVLRPLTDAWIANSRDVVAFVRRAHGAPADRVAHVPGGVDPDVFHPRVGGRRPGGPRIGGLGRLAPEKNWNVLVAALPRILDFHPGATLTIAGDGPCRGSLQTAATGLPVELPGLLRSPDRVATFLRDQDVVVLPSQYEGHPNAVLEARACGVPVVVTDVPGMAEAAGPHVPRVPADDPHALARAVVAALDGPPTGPPPAGRTLDDVAAEHLAVFEAAYRRRAVR